MREEMKEFARDLKDGRWHRVPLDPERHDVTVKVLNGELVVLARRIPKLDRLRF